MRDKDIRVLKILLIIVLFSTEANILLTLRCKPSAPEGEPLPCQAIPIQFVARHPDCANELIQAMNITNVHVVAYNSSRLIAGDHLRNRSPRADHGLLDQDQRQDPGEE